MHLTKDVVKVLEKINQNLYGIRKALEAQNTYIASRDLEGLTVKLSLKSMALPRKVV